MVTVHNLSVIYGDRALFDGISFFVSEKDRIGLTGKNGAGKSTLMKTIAGISNATSGLVSIPKGKKVGYLPQQMKHNENVSILEEATSAFAELNRFQARLEEINVELNERTDYESDGYMKIIQELTELNDRVTMMDGDSSQERAERVLKGLGFEQEELTRAMSTFSGGWKMRVELAKILLGAPDIMLLDEPTNHLDIESIEWLESFLIDHQGAVMLISHDKDFLDNITKRTIEISNGKIYDYKFNYSNYLIQRTDELERMKAAAINQQKYIEETKILINKFRAKKNKASFAQGLIKKLDKLEIIEVDDFDKTKISIKFPPAPHSGKVVVKAEGLSKAYGNNQIFKGLDLILPKGIKIALVGKNGVGKTTLLKVLTGQESHEGHFELGHKVSMGYFAQDEAEKLDESKTVFETIDDEAVGDIRTQIRNILGSFLFGGDDIDKKVSVLSGGERTRLAICKLLLQPHNLLIMDEPTNHLDLASKEVLKQALKNYDGTLILVSHDRNFLHGLAKDIFELKSAGLKHFVGDIYEFLEEKRARSIAAYEQESSMKKSADQIKAKVQAIPIEELSHADKKEKDKNIKRIQNHIQKLEIEIAEKDQELTKRNEELAHLDYSDAERSEKILDDFKEFQKNQEMRYKDWEAKLKELELLEG
jgi:ATP-binding cassette, subfamily F, member 3